MIWRRRSGLSQQEAAAQHEVSHRRWGRWERADEEPAVDKEIGELAIFEKLLLVRRRRQVSQSLVAKELGCTRAWVQMMESGNGSSEQLQNYWKELLNGQR